MLYTPPSAFPAVPLQTHLCYKENAFRLSVPGRQEGSEALCHTDPRSWGMAPLQRVSTWALQSSGQGSNPDTPPKAHDLR